MRSSTRRAVTFIAASYGQRYHELQRLDQAGLTTGALASSGGRARTAYELTDAGMGALVEPVPDDALTGCRMTLELGIGFNEWRIERCEATERRLTETSEVEAQ